ncbi:MAG: alkaline D-peptidase [Amycolatopsis sp.]|nr:alkaline D-peptidase [Amycolatopsis sp.]
MPVTKRPLTKRPQLLKKTLRVASAVAMAPVLALGSASVPASAAAQSGATAQLTQLARNLVDAGAPGVIVRVDDGRGHSVEIVEQARWAERDHPLEAGDEFRVGSNTKTMMATLVLQLVGEGKLALTDPVEKWLPGQVPNGGAITLRMLLNHTSGLYDYTGDPALVKSIVGKDQRHWTSVELLAVGVKNPPLFAPGTNWSYSNTDYVAIGAVLERVTGASLADLIRERITRPLNLKHTYFATDSSWRGRYAHGYELDAAHMPPEVPAEFTDIAGPRRDGHVDVSGNDPSWGGAAGAVVSTARDWSRFYAALMSGGLLPAAQLDQMLTTVPENQENPADGPASGLGIMTDATPCGTIWAHDGGMPGYLSGNLTERTGTRTASVLVPTELFTEFGADPKLVAAGKALNAAVVCTMLGKPAQTP